MFYSEIETCSMNSNLRLCLVSSTESFVLRLPTLIIHSFNNSSVATLPLLAVLFLTSLPIGHRASFLPGPGARFLFVLAQGATCPERPTAWSLPAVSTWHSLARGAGLHLQRPRSGTSVRGRGRARARAGAAICPLQLRATR